MTSKPSQKIITFEAFREELETAVTTFTKMAEEQLNKKGAPMAVSRDSLVEYIKQRMPQDEYIVQPKAVNIPTGLGPYFYRLPHELRDQIFSYLLVSGYPSFMRTSRLMNQEGKRWVTKEGIYRINLGFCNGINCQQPSREIVATIQNVNIRINNSILPSSSLEEFPELNLLDVFAGPAPHRKTCNVSFDFYGGGHVNVGYGVLSRLQRLRRFEKIVLRIWMNWTGGTAILGPSGDWLDVPVKAKIKYWGRGLPRMIRVRYSGFQLAREWLEPHLGKADLRSDKDGWIMVFYPRKAKEGAAIIGSGSDSRRQS